MPAKRLTAAQAKARGAWKKDPQRAREEVENDELGPPPPQLTPMARRIWLDVVNRAPCGALQAQDAEVLELLANLLVEYRQTGTLHHVQTNFPELSPVEARQMVMPTSRLAQITKILSSLGFTPTDRSKIPVTKKPDDKSDDEFGLW